MRPRPLWLPLAWLLWIKHALSGVYIAKQHLHFRCRVRMTTDINHDMLSELKALHVMLQDHIPKSRRWEHAWYKHNQNTGFRSCMASYYKALLMLFVLLVTKQTTNGNCLNNYSMKSHQTFSSNNNIQNGTISGWINIDKINIMVYGELFLLRALQVKWQIQFLNVALYSPSQTSQHDSSDSCLSGKALIEQYDLY